MNMLANSVCLNCLNSLYPVPRLKLVVTVENKSITQGATNHQNSLSIINLPTYLHLYVNYTFVDSWD